MNSISSEEFLQISNELEKHHAVFYKFWILGKPIYVENTETAYVQFDETGEVVVFGLNKKFWESCSFKKKCFIICHECMHSILNHGLRIIQKPTLTTNLGLDIVVNHLLISKYGFDRKEIDPKNELCWTDTMFPDPISTTKKVVGKMPGTNEDIIETTCEMIKPDESFEYYYNQLMQKKKEDKKNGKNTKSDKSLADDHDQSFKDLFDNESEENNGSSEPVIKKLDEALSNEEKDSLKEVIEKHFQKEDQNSGKGGQLADTGAGGMWTFVNVDAKKVKKKKKWETIIKKWSKKFTLESSKDIEQWARLNRRFTLLSKDLLIPSEMEVDEKEYEDNKIEVWFYLDTSGSCAHLAKRFFTAALSLPEYRFDIKLFCFDTQVYDVDIKTQKLSGFGGTSFHILERHVQDNIKKLKEKYPTVFVITDGYGNNIKMQHPKNWHWFLTNDYRQYIPSTCNFYNLSDFE